MSACGTCESSLICMGASSMTTPPYSCSLCGQLFVFFNTSGHIFKIPSDCRMVKHHGTQTTALMTVGCSSCSAQCATGLQHRRMDAEVPE